MPSPVGWMWSDADQQMVWWTGSDFTSNASWKGDHWVLSDDEHDPPSGPPPPPPRPQGWYERPETPGRVSYWNGIAWTGAERSLGSPNVRALGAVLLAVGTAVVVWGAVMAAGIDTGTQGMTPSEAFAYTCGTVGGDDHMAQGVGVMWFPWVALVAVVVAFIGLVGVRAPGVRWIRVASIAAAPLLLVTMPVWLIVGNGMNCGM